MLSQPSEQAVAVKPQKSDDCWALNFHVWLFNEFVCWSLLFSVSCFSLNVSVSLFGFSALPVPVFPPFLTFTCVLLSLFLLACVPLHSYIISPRLPLCVFSHCVVLVVSAQQLQYMCLFQFRFYYLFKFPVSFVFLHDKFCWVFVC